MTDWLIKLQGHQPDLKNLAEWLTSPDLKVKKDGEYFYLSSSEFSSLTDADKVRERAFELLVIVNGASKLRSENYLPVELDTVVWTDEEGELRQRAESSVTLKWRTLASQPPTEIESLVGIARGDERVADVLYFFQKGDWHSLYKAWELIGDAVGGEHKLTKKPWVNTRAKTRFTQTAQSRKVLGDDARHASKCYDKPIKGEPMTLNEARDFVRLVVEGWVGTL